MCFQTESDISDFRGNCEADELANKVERGTAKLMSLRIKNKDKSKKLRNIKKGGIHIEYRLFSIS